MRIRKIGDRYFASVIINKQIFIGIGMTQEEAIKTFEKNIFVKGAK